MVEESFTQQFLYFPSLGSILKSEPQGNSHSSYILGWFFIPTSQTSFERAALHYHLSWKGNKPARVFWARVPHPWMAMRPLLSTPSQVTQPFSALGTNSQTCDLAPGCLFLAQRQRHPMHPTSCCRRVIPRFPRSLASRPALLGAQSKKSTHRQWTRTSRCLPVPQTSRHGTMQKPSPDTMPAQISLQDPCLISPQHLKADFG